MGAGPCIPVPGETRTCGWQYASDTEKGPAFWGVEGFLSQWPRSPRDLKKCDFFSLPSLPKMSGLNLKKWPLKQFSTSGAVFLAAPVLEPELLPLQAIEALEPRYSGAADRRGVQEARSGLGPTSQRAPALMLMTAGSVEAET